MVGKAVKIELSEMHQLALKSWSLRKKKEQQPPQQAPASSNGKRRTYRRNPMATSNRIIIAVIESLPDYQNLVNFHEVAQASVRTDHTTQTESTSQEKKPPLAESA